MKTVSTRLVFSQISIPMEVVQVSGDVVETVLRAFDEHKSSGSDGLHPKILKILVLVYCEAVGSSF